MFQNHGSQSLSPGRCMFFTTVQETVQETPGQITGPKRKNDLCMEGENVFSILEVEIVQSNSS